MKRSLNVRRCGDRSELEGHLYELVSERNRSLLSQAEYENALEDLRSALVQGHVIQERELIYGRIRFMVRDETGQCLHLFEIQSSCEVEL